MNDSSDLPKRRRPRFGLATFLLFVTAVAIWLAGVPVARQTEELKQQLPGLRRVARELEVTDRTQFAAVGRTPTRFAESICDVFVPSGGRYELCLALEEIDEKGLAEPIERKSLTPGTYSIEIRHDTDPQQSRINILLDNEPALQQSRPNDWNPGEGSMGGLTVGECTTYPADDPLVLYRKRFMVATTPTSSSVPKEPCNGILVWIEKRREGGVEAE